MRNRPTRVVGRAPRSTNAVLLTRYRSRWRRPVAEGLVVVRAHAEAHLQSLARRVLAALHVGGLLVEDGQGGRADERAVLVTGGRILQRALREGEDARGFVGGARLEELALWRAEIALDALDRDLGLIGGAAVLRVVVVVLGRRGRRGRRGRGRRGRGRRRARWRERASLGGTLGVRRRVGETALVLVAHHADVARLAPRGAPRVLDLPVVLAQRRVRAVANDEHAVVELGAARLVVEHTTLVELERRLVGLDRDRNGADGDSGLERVLVALGHVAERRDRHDRLLLLGRLALTGDATARRVRVVRLSGDAVHVDPLEGVVHQTTLAAVVAVVVALHEVLLGERDQLLVRDLESALNGAGGAEGPARAAALLVLHRGDGASLDPVDGIGNLVAQIKVLAHHVLRRGVEVQLAHVRALEVLPRHVGEGVVAKPVGEVLGVDVVDDRVVGGKRVECGGLLLDGGVRFALGAFPGLELGRERREREARDNQRQHDLLDYSGETSLKIKYLKKKQEQNFRTYA